MTKTFRLPRGEPLLNIASYARGGLRAGDRLTPAQVEHIRRTVHREPEVVVKVLPRGCSDLKAVGKHLDYIGRHGDLTLESDDGIELHGRVGQALIEDWDLDIDELRPQANLTANPARRPSKLVHKLMFSMPPGTPPQKVLSAVRNFAREEFYGQHRYAMVLHTDEPHPHVHLVLKAISEEGARLHIKKATLRHWRSQFAHHLCELGVAANATERAVRGQSRKALKDGIYRASRRRDSNYMRARAVAVASELASGGLRSEEGRRSLLETWAAIRRGWQAVAEKLERQGERQLAADGVRFASRVEQPRTDREWIAQKSMATVRVRQRDGRIS